MSVAEAVRSARREAGCRLVRSRSDPSLRVSASASPARSAPPSSGSGRRARTPRRTSTSADLFRSEGFVTWDNFWYSGRHVFVTYSWLYYPLAAVVGIKLLATLSLAVAAVAFTRLVEWTPAALTFAVVWGLYALSGAYPFMLGVAFALLALLCATLRGSSLCSPRSRGPRARSRYSCSRLSWSACAAGAVMAWTGSCRERTRAAAAARVALPARARRARRSDLGGAPLARPARGTTPRRTSTSSGCSSTTG